MSRFIAVLLGVSLAATLIFGGGIWAGLTLQDAFADRTSIPFRARYKLVGYYNSVFRNNDQTTRDLETNRLRLTERTVFLPVNAADYAGGMTTVSGRDVLIFDRLGQFFHAPPEGIIVELDIPPPDNNADALAEQVKSGDLGPVTVDFKWFRYNDVLYLDADQSGRDTPVLLVSYTEWRPETLCFGSAIALIDVPEANPRDWRLPDKGWEAITRTEPCLPPFPRGNAIKGLEAGGRMVALEAGRIAWSSGAYERDDRVEGPDFSAALAQDPGTDYGKVIEVDLATGTKRTLARGLRNPQGLVRDARGRLWVTDHGMRGGDELNLVAQGANFGYPAVTYGTRYDRSPAGGSAFHANHDGYDQPVVAFVPSIAPGSAVAVEGFHYAWDGDVIVGAFDGSIYRVHVENDRAVYVEPVQLGVRSRDMQMLAGGTIAIWTDDRRIVYLSAAEGPDPVAVFQQKIAALDDENLRQQVGETFTDCLQCHSLAEGDHGAGPSLHGICGQAAAATDFEAYSSAMRSLGGVWNAARLAAFIQDPQSVVPETTMAWGGTGESRVSMALATLLCETGPL